MRIDVVLPAVGSASTRDGGNGKGSTRNHRHRFAANAGLCEMVAVFLLYIAVAASPLSAAAATIPDPLPDDATYFQILIDSKVSKEVHLTFTANQMSLTSPAIEHVTWLTQTEVLHHRSAHHETGHRQHRPA